MAFKAVQKLSSPPQCTSWQDRMRDYAWRSFLPMRRQGTEAVLLLTCLSLPLFLNTFIAPQEWITLTERCWKCGMSLAIGLSLLTNVLKSTLVRNDGFNRYCRFDLAMTLLLVPFPVHFGMGFWAQELQLFDLCLSLWKLSTLARSCEFGTPHQAGTEVLL